MPAWLPAVVLVFLLGGATEAARVDGELRIYIFNVGQADAILVVCPHRPVPHRLLIDSGAHFDPGSRSAFRQQLRALVPGEQPRLEVVVATHPHEDHVASMHWVLRNFAVTKFVDNGRPYTNLFQNIRSEAEQQHAAGTLTYIRATDFPARLAADFCPASNVASELLIPAGFGDDPNVNNNSVVLRVRYNRLRFLFTGDAEQELEHRLVEDPRIKPRIRNVTFYKAGHHGAANSSSEDLLAVISPQLAAVSSGRKNVAKNKGYRHPRAGALERILAHIPGAAAEVREIDAGLEQKGKWTRVEIRKGLYVTAIDDTILIVASGTEAARVPSDVQSPLPPD